jgi:hypothetical protein
VSDVRVYDVTNDLRFCHFPGIFALVDDVLESPESLGWDSEAATDGWSFDVADEAKVEGEEFIEDLLRCVAQFPKGKIGVCLRSWKIEFPVYCDPPLHVWKPNVRLGGMRWILFRVQLPHTLGFEEVFPNVTDLAVCAHEKFPLKSTRA